MAFGWRSVGLRIRLATCVNGVCQKFDWKNACINALLLTVICVCSGIIPLAIAQTITKWQIIVLCAMGVAEFFGFLASARDLKSKRGGD